MQVKSLGKSLFQQKLLDLLVNFEVLFFARFNYIIELVRKLFKYFVQVFRLEGLADGLEKEKLCLRHLLFGNTDNRRCAAAFALVPQLEIVGFLMVDHVYYLVRTYVALLYYIYHMFHLLITQLSPILTA